MKRACRECGALFEAKPSKRFCGAECRYQHWNRNNPRRRASQPYNASRAPSDMRFVVGRHLSFDVPEDWPDRSRRFWAGHHEITRRQHG